MTRLLLSMFLASTAIGCGQSGMKAVEGLPALEGSDPSTPLGGVSPPVLLPSPPSTNQPSLALRGSAQPGSSVFIQSPGAGAMPSILVGADGSFCADVPLKKNDLNMIDVRAQDDKGTVSQAATIMILQTGEAPRPTAPPASIVHNAASMADIAINENQFDVQNGALTDMVDDNKLSYVELDYDNVHIGGSKWIWLTFRRAQELVKTLTIASPVDCALADYSLYVSKVAQAGTSFSEDATWTKVDLTSGTDGDLKVDSITFPQAQRITHVALELTTAGCELGWAGWDTWRISEISATTEAESSPPPVDETYLCPKK